MKKCRKYRLHTRYELFLTLPVNFSDLNNGSNLSDKF